MTNQDVIETVGDAVQYCAKAMENAEVYFGHGTDSAWDEAVALVLAAADLPADSDQSVVARKLTQVQIAEFQKLLSRRIEDRVPLPYLIGKAWFAGLEFLCDDRAIIPRSPIAELIRRGFGPWYDGL